MPNFNKTTTTDEIQDYSFGSKSTDAGQDKRNTWHNDKAAKYYELYHEVGEYRAAINAFVIWTIGQGYTTTGNFQRVLDKLDGWGEDTFDSIIFNLLCTKKFDGDSYAHIVRNPKTGTLINLKPLDPDKITHVTNDRGRIIEYEYQQGKNEVKTYKPNEIFHLCNDRILDEPHGTAVTSAVEWVCEAIKEGRLNMRRSMKLSTIRIMYVDENDTTRQQKIKEEYKEAIEKGKVLILTCKPEEAKLEDLSVPPSQAWIIYLDHLEDKFYKQLGVPKVVLGGTADNTEASAKVGVISYEPIWSREIRELELDIFNQLGIILKFNRQPSLMGDLQTNEEKNTGQTKLELQGSQ